MAEHANLVAGTATPNGGPGRDASPPSHRQASPQTPSPAVEDYAKAIYALTHTDGHARASTNALAQRLGISAASVSAMVRRLHVSGLADHLRYQGTKLTPRGEQLALHVIRRHRLLELFLTTSLDLPWDQVHRHAEALEHAATDELIETIATRLGHPATDPHGHPIPSRDLELHQPTARALADMRPGEPPSPTSPTRTPNCCATSPPVAS